MDHPLEPTFRVMRETPCKLVHPPCLHNGQNALGFFFQIWRLELRGGGVSRATFSFNLKHLLGRDLMASIHIVMESSSRVVKGGAGGKMKTLDLYSQKL